MTIGPESRIRIFEMSVRLGIMRFWPCFEWAQVRGLSPSIHLQSLRLNQRSNPILVLKNCLVNPGVPRLVLDHSVGALAAHQLAVGLDFKIAIDQMPIGAVFGVGAFGQSDGSSRIDGLELADGVLHRETMLRQVPVQLLMQK